MSGSRNCATPEHTYGAGQSCTIPAVNSRQQDAAAAAAAAGDSRLQRTVVPRKEYAVHAGNTVMTLGNVYFERIFSRLQ